MGDFEQLAEHIRSGLGASVAGVISERPIGPGLVLRCNEARAVRHALYAWVEQQPVPTALWTPDYLDLAMRYIFLFLTSTSAYFVPF